MSERDLNGYDTAYRTSDEKDEIEQFDQMLQWYHEIGLAFPEKVYTIFLEDMTGEILCSE